MEHVRRFPGGERVADLLLWLAVTTPLLLPDDDEYAPAGLPLGWVKIAAVPLLGLAVLVCRRQPVAAAVVPAALGLAASPEVHTSTLALAQATFVYLLGRRAADRRPALWFFAGLSAAGGLLLLVAPDAATVHGRTFISNVLLVFVLPWLAGQYMRLRAELVRSGWQLAERLEQQQHLAGDQARLRERTRIATDMHDSLGHELALIAVRAAALQVAEDVGLNGRQAASELRQSAAASSRRLREVIGVLREDDEAPPMGPSGKSVTTLVQNAAASGVPVTLHDHLMPPDGGGATQELPPMTDRAIFRVVQEALTNAAKHAEGAPVTVTLLRDGTQAVVTVTNGTPPNAALPGPPENVTGYGLIGLDERVRQAGGTLHAHPAGLGFTVTARLPLTVGAPATPPGETSARRAHTAARRTARRRALHTIWLPMAAVAALLLLMILNNRGTESSVLDKQDYNELRVGDPQQAVEDRLPPRQLRPEPRPAAPNGAEECRYYRTNPESSTPAYQLCFTDGRLSQRDRVRIAG
ncbi:histidine kinase [Streptomyces sp. NPDC020766]|uniref:sensor histidine kinase n=1 Tax=Streptomyces sp. NPDC020766 TaxID=3155011 RepID=UPI0033CCF865